VPSVSRLRERSLVKSATLGLALVRARSGSAKRKREAQAVFLSNTFSNSGAPLVLAEIVEEMARSSRFGTLRLLAPSAMPDLAERLTQAGVMLEPAANLGVALSRFQLALERRDFVLMNTAAVNRDYTRVVFSSLAEGRLDHAYWFLHENVGQLTNISAEFASSEYLATLRELVKQGRLTIAVPSVKVKAQYDALLESSAVRVVWPRVTVADRYRRPRSPSDYASLRFVIVGHADGRKRQELAVTAFQELLRRWVDPARGRYREFTLSLIGLRDTQVVRELIRFGESVLGARLTVYPVVTPDEVLELTYGCNASICCALYEGFPLYVAEGMAMGHVLIRNDSGGREEQLEDGVNGYAISDDVGEFAAVLERLLNRESTTDSDLWRMGDASRRRIEPYRHTSYLEQLG
jgi:glycosyltransferase involved in cell wall biosynthesis